MKRVGYLLAMYAVVGLGIFSSCSSESDPVIESGEGGITLALTAETGFQSTKAVNEEDYTKVDGYTVQIYKDGVSSPIVNETLADFKAEVEKDEKKLYRLSNGAYTLKAFYGENKPVSTSSMFVYGEQAFSVNNNSEAVAITCKPACARVKVVFASSMEDHFSDYSVVFETKALGESTFTWKKSQTDPAYLIVDKGESVKATINLTSKAGKTSSVSKTYVLSPAMAQVINVKPVIASGNIGIEITIDETTNDIPVDIVIPSDWK